MTTPKKTFTALGYTWTSHTPGDPMPCDPDVKVCVLFSNELSINAFINTNASTYARNWTWGKIKNNEDIEIIGWRYADEPQEPKPASAWRPIAEAPKDGIRVLGTWESTWLKSPHIEVVTWDNDGRYWWYVCDGDQPNCPPTHFMPLPEPPAD